MAVDFRHLEIRVPEQLADDVERDAALDQVAGERVSQRVKRQRLTPCQNGFPIRPGIQV